MGQAAGGGLGLVSRPGLHWWIGSISRNSSRHAGNRNQPGSLHSCHTLARYASFDAVPFISMHKTTVGQKSRKPMTIAVYEGKIHRRPTSEENDWLGFESLPLRHLMPVRWRVRVSGQGPRGGREEGYGVARSASPQDRPKGAQSLPLRSLPSRQRAETAAA